MISVEVLGSGCANCRHLLAVLRIVAGRLGLEIEVVPTSDPVRIARRGVLSLPGLVIADRVVSAGRVPTAAELTAWLTEAAARA